MPLTAYFHFKSDFGYIQFIHFKFDIYVLWFWSPMEIWGHQLFDDDNNNGAPLQCTSLPINIGRGTSQRAVTWCLEVQWQIWKTSSWPGWPVLFQLALAAYSHICTLSSSILWHFVDILTVRSSRAASMQDISVRDISDISLNQTYSHASFHVLSVFCVPQFYNVPCIPLCG